MRNELKPCPFCGTNHIRLGGGENINGNPFWYICCNECGCSQWGGKNKEEVVKNWNTRVQSEHFADREEQNDEQIDRADS